MGSSGQGPGEPDAHSVAASLFHILSAGKGDFSNPGCCGARSQTPLPHHKDPSLPNSMTAVVSFLLLKIKKAAQNSTFFKAPRTKSPFPVIDPTLFIYLFCPARGAQSLPPNDLEPVEGLRASDPPPLGRAAGVGRGCLGSGRPLPQGHLTFPAPRSSREGPEGGGSRGARWGRGAAPLPRGGRPPRILHWPERAAGASADVRRARVRRAQRRRPPSSSGSAGGAPSGGGQGKTAGGGVGLSRNTIWHLSG